MNLTDKQKARLLATAEIVDKGDVAVLSKLFETDELLEKQIERIDEVVVKAEQDVSSFTEKANSELESIKSEVNLKLSEVQNGKDYTLTEEDKTAIASKITVPVVERVVETIIKEQPTVTEITKVEVKEVAVVPDLEEMAVNTVNYIETLQGEDRLDVNALKGTEEIKREIKEAKNIAVANALPVTTTHFFRDGVGFGRAKNIEFINSKVEVVGDRGIITPITVSDTAPSDPFLNMLWLDIS